MTEAERLAEWLEEKAHNHAQDDIVEWSRMVETAALIRTQSARIAALEEALREWLKHDASVFMGPDGEKAMRASKRGVVRKVRKALGKGSE